MPFQLPTCVRVTPTTFNLVQMSAWDKTSIQQMAQGVLRYGMNVSQTALMTCLVTSPTDNLHVHFVDGGDGGYTNAAKTMKAQARAAAVHAPTSA